MEDALIRRAQAGEQSAFRALVEQYTPVAWRVARALLAERGAAEDTLQEAWLDAWRGLPQLDPARPFRPWLLTIVANRCRMQARRRSLPTRTLDDELAERLPALDDLSALGESGDDEALYNALATLSAERRRLLALRYQAELELAEIAQVCDLPLGTVKSRLSRTLAELRARLGVTAHPTTSTPPTPTPTTKNQPSPVKNGSH